MADESEPLSSVAVSAGRGDRRLVAIVLDIRDDFAPTAKRLLSQLTTTVQPRDVVTLVLPAGVFRPDDAREYLEWLFGEESALPLLRALSAVVPDDAPPPGDDVPRSIIGDHRGFGAFEAWSAWRRGRIPWDAREIMFRALRGTMPAAVPWVAHDAKALASATALAVTIPAGTDNVVVVADQLDSRGRDLVATAGISPVVDRRGGRSIACCHARRRDVVRALLEHDPEAAEALLRRPPQSLAGVFAADFRVAVDQFALSFSRAKRSVRGRRLKT